MHIQNKKHTLIENVSQLGTDTDLHEEIDFSSIHFNQIPIANHTFENCNFSHCSFRETEMPDAAFHTCFFRECEIIVLKMTNVALNDVIFEDCKIMGIDFSECSAIGFSPEFRNCIISNSVFYGISLRKGYFLDCRLTDCDLTDCDFREATFSGSQFEHVTINNCNFGKADFRGCHGYAIDPNTNKILNARFSLPEAQSFLTYLGIRIGN